MKILFALIACCLLAACQSTPLPTIPSQPPIVQNAPTIPPIPLPTYTTDLSMPNSVTINSKLPQISTLLSDFRASNWTSVHRAKWQLESLQQESIPALLSLLDIPETVKLTETADLIYPGAETFYGHGGIIDYDLDYIPARAGWALEELTFQDFGFSEGRIKEQELLQQTIKGNRDVPLGDVLHDPPDPVTRQARLQDAISRAKEWWKDQGATWTRFEGLRDALENGTSERQSRAIGWIRTGTSKCDGLNPDSYQKDLYPIIMALANSEDEGVREQATYLVNEKDGWWKSKTDPELRKWEDPSGR